MARRRLQLILATTTITVGLAAAPAAAQDLGGLTDLVEETASTAEGVVSSVEETATEVVDTVTETVAPSSSEPAPSSPTSEADDPLVDVQLGTGDGTLDVDLQVDVAPSDADGSPQLEIDGGATVADQHVDVGGATDPIEDAVDPDPAPSTAPEPPASGGDGGTDGDTTPATAQPDGPGGFLEGGGVVAAGDDARPVPTPGDDPAAQSLGSGFAAFGALDRGSFGLNRYGGDTMALDAVPDPEVAPPAVADAPVETPQVLDPEFAPESPETPAVYASGPSGATDEGPLAGLLKALAAAMVLGTGTVWTRATREG